jgi:tetratricopeptide (TPR) repeat protein
MSSIKSRFLEKVSKLIFLEFKKESILNIFQMEATENIFLPVRPFRVIDKVQKNDMMEKIPVSFFIEGMFFVLGADENFKYNSIYRKLIETRKDEATHYIKGIVFDEVKNNSYEDSYILLKGLLNFEKNEEIFEKIFILLESLSQKDKNIQEEQLEIIKKAKQVKGYNKPYLYEAIIYYNSKKYKEADICLTKYIEVTDDNGKEIIELKKNITNVLNYEKGIELVKENPEESLKYLIPLLDDFDDDAILKFNIAVSYRKLGLYEKAIYYLNEALSIDSSLVEIVNELGINYASLNDFESAIKYLRKAFEATKSIEICTNLIMCYFNNGDYNAAKLHYEIAKKIDPKDEIVLKLKDAF